MDVVFLTGAGSEPAQSIARRLVTSGFRVYGFAAQFPQQGFRHEDFIPVPVNLTDPASVRAEVSAILAQETTVTGVILAGSYPVEEPFEATHAEDIPLALEAGIISPLVIVRAVLPMLIRRHGHVIAITRTANNAGAALTAVANGALQHFTRALFAELRDTGVKAAHLQLAGNPGAVDPATRFTQTPQSQIQPDIVADAVENLLRLRENNALTELVLRPQATREEPRLPVSTEPRLRSIQVVQLPPPQNFPPPDEIIQTPERKRPDYAPPPGEDDDEDAYLDDEDNSVDPELLYLIKPNHQRSVVRESQQRPSNSGNNRPAQDPRQNKQQRPRAGSLKIHPKTPSGQTVPQQNDGKSQKQPQQNQRQQPQARDNGKTSPQPTPYPPNWHWPRPPSPQQLERMARQKKHAPQPAPAPVRTEKPQTPAEPIKDFIPPPPREAPPSDIPEFVPPVFAKAPETASIDKPDASPDSEPVSPGENLQPAEEDSPKASKAKAPKKTAKRAPAKKTEPKTTSRKSSAAAGKSPSPRKKPAS
ncbi:MAG: SDR family NAD(P)-dependent oxidoreductase [Puniceicoccales bacterium]|jgi:NADP-dependent 3-hydroxy acid dehydrogenase YdfG|nr:SDR family NAD(P)-dependent oxidoreductase [Puniceicoccales bacterium]